MLKGGISTNSGCFFLVSVLVRAFPLWVVLERWVPGGDGLVFGTLLGPEATGPRMVSFSVMGLGVVGGFCLFLVSLP